jgi:hypothetical protein
MFNTLLDTLFNFTLMESLLLFDSIICSTFFIKDYIIVKLNEKNITNCKKNSHVLQLFKSNIIKNYNNIYTLNIIDRYMLYLSLYLIYEISIFSIQANISDNYSFYFYFTYLSITLPIIQNTIISIFPIQYYFENKNIFYKYNLSKCSVQFIQHLHPQIEKITNYHIFLIYSCINVIFIWNIIKNASFILLLVILKNNTITYYYYKAIKMAYYYNVGYLYTTLNLEDALYLANTIIKEKRWEEFAKIQNINAFLTIIINKYSVDQPNTWDSQMIDILNYIQIKILQIFSLFSFISLLKIINKTSSNNNPIYCFSLFIIICIFIRKLNLKNIITSLILSFLITFNINDLIITFVIISNKLIYYWLEEIYFFIKNIHNIRKIINNDKKNYIANITQEYLKIN